MACALCPVNASRPCVALPVRVIGTGALHTGSVSALSLFAIFRGLMVAGTRTGKGPRQKLAAPLGDRVDSAGRGEVTAPGWSRFLGAAQYRWCCRPRRLHPPRLPRAVASEACGPWEPALKRTPCPGASAEGWAAQARLWCTEQAGARSRSRLLGRAGRGQEAGLPQRGR